MTRRYRIVPIPDPGAMESRQGMTRPDPVARAAQIEATVNAVIAEYDGQDAIVEWLGPLRKESIGVDALAFEIFTSEGAADSQTRLAIADAALPAPIDAAPGSVMVAVDRAWLVDVLADAQTYSGDDHVREIADRARPVLIVGGTKVVLDEPLPHPLDTPIPDPTS